MDLPIHIDTLNMGLPIAYFRGHIYRKNFLNCDVFLSLKVVEGCIDKLGSFMQTKYLCVLIHI